MSTRAVAYMTEEINKMLSYVRNEYNITYSEALGTLFMAMFQLAAEAYFMNDDDVADSQAGAALAETEEDSIDDLEFDDLDEESQ